MSSKKSMRLIQRSNFTVVALGEMEIWDGADLALLRETLTRLVRKEKCKSVGVDMTYVKYVPSGFFGMMFDWHEEGVRVRLYCPQPNVKSMLWFERFFEDTSGSSFDTEAGYELRPDSPRTNPTQYAPVTASLGRWGNGTLVQAE